MIMITELESFLSLLPLPVNCVKIATFTIMMYMSSNNHYQNKYIVESFSQFPIHTSYHRNHYLYSTPRPSYSHVTNMQLKSTRSSLSTSSITETTTTNPTINNRNIYNDKQSNSINPLGPPEILKSLSIKNKRKINKQRPYYDPSFQDLSKPQQHTYTISRIGNNVDVFLLENFMTPFECEAIIHEALYNYNTNDDHDNNGYSNGNEKEKGSRGMTIALSQDGNTQQTRSNCKVAWFSDSRLGNICGMIGNATVSALVTDEAKVSKDAERSDMQVLHYEKDGKFVLHHDGNHRILTVICYLNGVGETWLPLVNVYDDDGDDVRERGSLNVSMLNDLDEAVHYVNEKGMRPGQNGLLISGSATIPKNIKNPRGQHQSESQHNPHIVKVNPGDAIAFYSYHPQSSETSSTCSSSNEKAIGTKDWRSIHAGLTVDHVGNEGKWLATCWFQAPSLVDSA